MSRRGSGAVTFSTGALGCALARRLLEGRPPGGRDRWLRRNFRDREVTLLLGPAVAAGALTAVAVAPQVPGRARVVSVTAAAALVGLYDDLAGDSHARGLGGHGRALRAGRMTTGLVKLAVLTGAGFGASVSGRGGSGSRSLAIGCLDTVLIAGAANLLNLLDLRPGRAAKVTLLVAAATGRRRGAPAVLAAAGSVAVALPADLGEAGMLGDCGAGTLGALLGCAVAEDPSPPLRALCAAAVVALTLVSEQVSFSAVIDRHPVLRRVDRFGRRPG